MHSEKKLVENKIWKFRSGYSIGDVFNIDNNYTKMNNDTIYVNGMAIALFVNFERRFFADNILTIKSIKENHIGEYCEK